MKNLQLKQKLEMVKTTPEVEILDINSELSRIRGGSREKGFNLISCNSSGCNSSGCGRKPPEPEKPAEPA